MIYIDLLISKSLYFVKNSDEFEKTCIFPKMKHSVFIEQINESWTEMDCKPIKIQSKRVLTSHDL